MYTSNTVATPTNANSRRRILRDLKQWKQCSDEVPTITAYPLDNNIYEWHANMIADYGLLKGVKFHLILTFPDNYPQSPPSIELCNFLKHPNVFPNAAPKKGYWICLDMIKQSTISQKYRGWTSAYSIISILLQLQSFLISNKVEQMYGSPISLEQYLKPDIIQKIKNESNKFKCTKCRHSAVIPKNNSKQITISQIKDPKKPSTNNNVLNYWNLLYSVIEDCILEYMTYCDCVYFNCVCKQFRQIIERNKILELHRFGCWYHKIDLNYCQKTLGQYSNNKINKNVNNDHDDMKMKCDDMNLKQFEDKNVLNNMILGYGFTPIFFDRLSLKPYFNDYLNDITFTDDNKDDNYDDNLKFIKLHKCDITFDLLSYDAFKEHGVRTTVWKENKFTHFLPIYINPKHGQKSMKLFEVICFNIFKESAAAEYRVFKPKKYTPFMGIHLVSTIMSSLVVAVKSCSDLNKPNLYYSINVIETYFHLYHLLLAIYHKYVTILSPYIEQKCVNFIKNENLRTKKYVSNFGVFRLNFVLCNKYKWKDIVIPFVEETFIRKVKWLAIKDEYDLLRTVKPNENKDYRISQTWKLNKKRGFLFQYFFLRHCSKIGQKSPSDKFKEFNDNHGCPPKGLAINFQNFVRKIYSVKDIYAWFKIIEIDADKDFIYKIMANACNKSLKHGYHKEFRAYRRSTRRSYRRRRR